MKVVNDVVSTHGGRPQKLEAMIRMHLPIPCLHCSHVWMIVLPIIQLPKHFLCTLSSACEHGRESKPGKRRCGTPRRGQRMILYSLHSAAGERRPARPNDLLQEVQQSFVRGAQVRVRSRGCSYLREDTAMPCPTARWVARHMGCRASFGRLERHSGYTSLRGL